MKLFAGTSGFSYKEWKGTFYPADLAAGDMLEFYAQQLPAVEINNTFYRMPRSNVLESWSETVADDFRFVVKASRRITHQKRLKDVGEETGYLLNKLEILGDRLGAVLFQLPPFLHKDLERLQTFLDPLPDSLRAAIEFCHASWLDVDVFAALRVHNAALCVADTDEEDTVETLSTADWGYLRLRRANYTDTALQQWLDRMRTEHWSSGFVFFKHEDEGAGPALARRFLELAGNR